VKSILVAALMFTSSGVYVLNVPPCILDGTYVHKNFAAYDFKQLTESQSHAMAVFSQFGIS